MDATTKDPSEIKAVLELFSDEELIRFRRRAELAGKLNLSKLFKNEIAEREQIEIIKQ